MNSISKHEPKQNRQYLSTFGFSITGRDSMPQITMLRRMSFIMVFVPERMNCVKIIEVTKGA